MDFIFDIDYKIKELVVSSENKIINCLNKYKSELKTTYMSSRRIRVSVFINALKTVEL